MAAPPPKPVQPVQVQPPQVETRVHNPHRVQNCLDQILQNPRVGSSLFRRDFKVSNKCGEVVADHCLELGLDVMSEAAQIAKLRNAAQVEPVDVNFVLVRKYNIRVQPSISKLPRLVLHEESLGAGSESLRHTVRPRPPQVMRDSFGNVIAPAGTLHGSAETHFTLGNEPIALPTTGDDDGAGGVNSEDPKSKKAKTTKGGRGKASTTTTTTTTTTAAAAAAAAKEEEIKEEKDTGKEEASPKKATPAKRGRGKRKR